MYIYAHARLMLKQGRKRAPKDQKMDRSYICQRTRFTKELLPSLTASLNSIKGPPNSKFPKFVVLLKPKIDKVKSGPYSVSSLVQTLNYKPEEQIRWVFNEG